MIAVDTTAGQGDVTGSVSLDPARPQDANDIQLEADPVLVPAP
jgi:hypothetical protein